MASRLQEEHYIMTASKYIVPILFILLSTQTHCFACQCQKSTYRFVDNLHKYHFVGLVEVIGRDTVVKSQDDYTFTKVRIINQYHGDFVGHNLSIVEAKGFECITRLETNRIGDKAIIKGFYAEAGEYLSAYDVNTNQVERRKLESPVLILSLCDKNQLYVNGDTVKGYITKNKPNAKVQRGRTLHKLSFGLISTRAFKRGGYSHSEGLQEYTLAQVTRIIRRRINGH